MGIGLGVIVVALIASMRRFTLDSYGLTEELGLLRKHIPWPDLESAGHVLGKSRYVATSQKTKIRCTEEVKSYPLVFSALSCFYPRETEGRNAPQFPYKIHLQNMELQVALALYGAAVFASVFVTDDFYNNPANILLFRFTVGLLGIGHL